MAPAAAVAASIRRSILADKLPSRVTLWESLLPETHARQLLSYRGSLLLSIIASEFAFSKSLLEKRLWRSHAIAAPNGSAGPFFAFESSRDSPA